MKKVLVTGASGFIAKHIVRELLDKGYEVRGSIRSEKRQAEIEELFPDANIEFVELDLLEDDGWDEHTRHLVGQLLDGGPRSLRVSNHGHDPGQQRVGPDLLGPDEQAASTVHGGADHVVPFPLAHWNGLPRDHRLVDRAAPLDHHGIDRDLLTRSYPKSVPDRTSSRSTSSSVPSS